MEKLGALRDEYRCTLEDSVKGKGTPNQKEEKTHYDITLACILYDDALLCKEDQQKQEAFKTMLKTVWERVPENKEKVDLFTWLHYIAHAHMNRRGTRRHLQRRWRS